jgi:hypothetical protein
MSGKYHASSGNPHLDRAAVLAVWRGNLGREARHTVKYSWFYEHCPFGPPLLALLRQADDPALLGVAAAGVRQMLYMGRKCQAGVLVDMAVVPAHRSFLPALMLQKFILQSATGSFDLLYGVPNRKAAPVFVRAGYRKLGDLFRLVRVVQSDAVLARVLPAFLARLFGFAADRLLDLMLALRSRQTVILEWQDEPWGCIDAIWSESQKPDGPIAVRDSVFVRWRLGSSPGGVMRFAVAHDNIRSKPVAWLACEKVDDTLFVRDFWGLDGVGEWVESALVVLGRGAKSLGCNQLCLEYMGCEAGFIHLRRAGFVRRNSRPVFGKLLSSQSDAANIELHLTTADEDE